MHDIPILPSWSETSAAISADAADPPELFDIYDACIEQHTQTDADSSDFTVLHGPLELLDVFAETACCQLHTQLQYQIADIDASLPPTHPDHSAHSDESMDSHSHLRMHLFTSFDCLAN